MNLEEFLSQVGVCDNWVIYNEWFFEYVLNEKDNSVFFSFDDVLDANHRYYRKKSRFEDSHITEIWTHTEMQSFCDSPIWVQTWLYAEEQRLRQGLKPQWAAENLPKV